MIETMVLETTEPVTAFTDESMIRRIHAEGIVLLGGGRALLMQIAHPAVAAGVAEHSSFRTDRLQRLLRTLRPTLAIAFGRPDQVWAAAGTVNATHARVVGHGYRALDPALLAWVLATLIDTTLLMHDRFVRPLSEDEAEGYYEDMKTAGRLLLIPDGTLPATLRGFHSYVDEMVATLAVSGTARELAAAIFRPSGVAAPLLVVQRELSAALLPERLRSGFGLGWGSRREASVRAAERLSCRLWPLLPARMRRPPSFLMPG